MGEGPSVLSNVKPPTDKEDHPRPIIEAVKWIRGIWYFIATFFALLTFINATAPDVVKPGTFLGDTFRRIIDWVYDRPTLQRVDPTIPSNPTARDGFAYYEVSKAGRLTDDGQLAPHPRRPMPPFEQLKTGDILRANSRIYLRAGPSGDTQLVGVLQSGECIIVIEGQKTSYPVKDAASGGWLPIQRVSCPNS